MCIRDSVSSDFEKVLNQNLKIPLLAAHLFLKNKVLSKGASIYFISSIAAETNKTGNAYYSIAKNGLNFAAKILGNEQIKRGVRVNVITLGIVNNAVSYTHLRAHET